MRTLTALKKHRIVSDVISSEPKEIAKVCFSSGVEADLGNILAPKQVQDVPIVEWTADPSEFYTLCMIDPDAPGRRKPLYREWQHWLVVNIPGNDVCSGEILTAFIGSKPLKNSGLHRYIFLIYQQPCYLTFEEKYVGINCRTPRRKFRISKFALKYALGRPIACNFYQSRMRP